MSDPLADARDEIDDLKKRIEEWRQDAAARLETYIALMNSGLIGDPTQVKVSLIMPTYAMLLADTTGDFFEPCDENGDPLPPYTINIDELLPRVKSLIAISWGDEEQETGDEQ